MPGPASLKSELSKFEELFFNELGLFIIKKPHLLSSI